MFKLGFYAFVLTSFSMGSYPAWAQLDASSALLVPGGSASPQETGLESGRYKVKSSPKKGAASPDDNAMSITLKKTTVQKKSSKTIKTEEIQLPAKNTDQDNLTPSPTPTSKTEEISSAEKPMKEEKTTLEVEQSSTPAQVVKTSEEGPTAEGPRVEEKPDPPVAEQMKNLILGENKKIEIYQEQIHPDDIRKNKAEVTILPGFNYIDSHSQSWYRSYNSFSPNLDLDVMMWMTPFFGLHANYFTSLGADISANNSTSDRIPVSQENFDFGVHFRRFYGLSRRAPSLEFGIDMIDEQFKAPPDDTNRARLKTSGVALTGMARIPTAPRYSWIFKGMLAPKLSHSELATGINLQSGDSVETNKIGLGFGGEIKFLRSSQIIWELNYYLEKNSFSGASNQVDPVTGTNLSNVSVTNSMTVFSFGYRWGS